MSTFRFSLLGGAGKLDPKARAAALKLLQTQSVLSWSETEVGVWLEENGFPELVKPFVKNGITGESLASISDGEY